MGATVRCAKCGRDVYTTGNRFPYHQEPNGEWCSLHGSHREQDKIEYHVGTDDDLGACSAGLPTLGKRR